MIAHMKQGFLSTAEAAKMLGVSRIAIFKKIQSQDIKAKKFGRNYAIAEAEITKLLDKTLDEKRKNEVRTAVRRVVKDYGETLRLLGAE